MSENELHRVIRAASGASHVFCSEICTDLWMAGRNARDSSPLEVAFATRSLGWSCTACGWCGGRVTEPTARQPCLFHDTCPEFDWAASDCASQAVNHVLGMTGSSNLPSEVFDVFAEVAQLLRADGLFPSLQRLVEGVMARSVEWLP